MQPTVTLTKKSGKGLTDRVISEIENGHKNLSVMSLIRIAKVLDERPGKLLDSASSD